MPVKQNPITRFFAELKHREVFSTAAYYFAVSWGGIEITEWVLQRWQITPPEWLMPLLATALVVGFPVSMLLAWMYDFSGSGIHRTASTGRKSATNLLLAGILMLGGTFGLYYLIGTPEAPQRVMPPVYAPKFAVLPFESLGGEELADFASGIHLDLTRNLGRLGSIRVISRQSVMPYLDTDKPLQQIAEELEVDGVLTGVVQRSGDRVRIAMSLLDGDTDLQLWDKNFEFNFTPDDFFELQLEVAELVAEVFEASLSEIDRARIGTAPTHSLTAYEAYLQGQLRLETRIPADARIAEEKFQQAIRIDPDYALAYVGLARVYMLLSRQSTLNMQQANETIATLVKKALSLNDQLSEAWLLQAGLMWRRGDPSAEVEAAFRQALSSDPNHGRTLTYYAYFIKIVDKDLRSAEELMKRALELNPLSSEILSRYAEILEELNRPDEAIAIAERALRITPNQSWADMMLGFVYFTISNRYVDAWEQWWKVAEYDAEHTWATMGLSVMALHMLDRATAEYWAEESWRRAPGRWQPCWARAFIAVKNNRSPLDTDERCLETLRQDNFIQRYQRDRFLASGQAEQARAFYAEQVPQIFDPEHEFVDQEFRYGIDLYPVLLATGQPDLARLLLDKSEAYVQGHYRLSSQGYDWADVEIHALRGEREQALAAMRSAIDEGLRQWWIFLPDALNLQSLWNDPGFEAMLDEIRAEMTQRRDEIRSRFPDSVVRG